MRFEMWYKYFIINVDKFKNVLLQDKKIKK